MSCPVEVNKKKKRRGKVRNIKSHVLSYEKDSLTITPAIGCLGGGMKNFKKDVNILFKNKKELEKVRRSCVVAERNNYVKSFISTVDMRCH